MMPRIAFHPSLATLPALCALALLAGCSGGDDSTETPTPSPAKLTLLFTSDEHSHMLAESPELDDYPAATSAGSGPLLGGVARRATILEAERAAAASAGAATLTVSAGDNDMGALPQVAFAEQGLDFQLLSELGYDATTLGNHEFDFGPGALAQALGAADAAGKLPPVVISNIHFDAGSSADDALAALYSETASDDAAMHPYRVVTTSNGLKVGLVGFVGANAAYVAPLKTPVRFSAPTDELEPERDAVLPLLYADVQPVVDHLRQVEQVDLVVALGHSGMGGDLTEEGTLAAEDYRICENVVGLDVIVSGHSHRTDAEPITVAQNGGRECLVLNAGENGNLVGRVEYTLTPGGGTAPSWDPATQALLPVDEAVVPNEAFASSLGDHIATIEAAGGSPSYLEQLLSRVEGATVTDDPATPGDLYFRKLGHTSFDVSDEKLVGYLSADAMLAAADELALPTDMGLESGGPTRAPLMQGKTGDISVADAFNVVPLGSSPLDGSMGYPLVRANLELFELRAVFEFSATIGPTNSDYRLAQGGVRVEFDYSRPPVEALIDLFNADKGWVVKIEVDSDHTDGLEQFDTVLFDRTAGIETPDLISVVTSSYIAEFASSVGVSLKDDAGEALTIEQAVLHRPDDSEVKQLEAFFSYLKAQPGGELAPRYDAGSGSTTERQPCVGGCG